MTSNLPATLDTQQLAPPVPRRLQIPRADLLAVVVLIGLWLLFFWRLFTPIEGDQASLKQGDFSGQFVAFAAYQYQRFAQGEVPLWNPYNNGGFPFIADTQSAVFYPPRLATIALANLSGGWSYHALELEMTVHVLFYTLCMYILVRRMSGSVVGGLVAALIAGYGGYLSGYPPLQLALLEAGVWLPLAVLGIFEATQKRLSWSWLLLTGVALGLSWLAGHPQTSWFLTYLLVAYFAYRVYLLRLRWPALILGTALFGLLAFGLAAIQLLPGLEYLPYTARVDFTFNAKGNGFPVLDLIQFLFPGVVSLFSPLYIGVIGLTLAAVAIWRGVNAFWLVVALIALGLSFGANTAVFPALYNLLPGLRFFRGQERAAYLVANSFAILAGLGIAHLTAWDKSALPAATRNIRRGLIGLVTLCGAALAISLDVWLQNPTEQTVLLNTVVFSLVMAAAALVLIWSIMDAPRQTTLHAVLIGFIAFELFTINLDAPSNYDSVPPSQQLSITVLPLVAPVLADNTNPPFRVDGYRGLHDNSGSLYSVMDMRGISPLFLATPFAIMEPDKINPLAWELFAVRYVYSDWQELPVASEIVASGEDRYGSVSLHQLTDPRPFAHLVYAAEILDSDAFALALLRDPNFNPRTTAILNRAPDLSGQPADPGTATVTSFAPESFTIEVSTPANALLTLAHPDYPGWRATLDNKPADILRAYGGLSAVAVPAGDHTIRFVYDPVPYCVGLLITLSTLILLVIMLIALPLRLRRLNNQP